jgi:hypothetical protein
LRTLHDAATDLIPEATGTDLTLRQEAVS